MCQHHRGATALRLLLLHVACLQTLVASAATPDLDPWKPCLLPGQTGVVFPLYAPPSDLASLQALIKVMDAEGLGNGFDPGPALTEAARPALTILAARRWPVVFYPPRYGEFQIQGSRSVLADGDEALLRVFEEAGAFTGLQLGEWGYYFHDLSTNAPWWQSVFGAEFDTYKHLMKPVGLKGFDVLPTSRREAHDRVRDYFLSRSRDLRGRIVSVTGHSHYESYAAAWGASVIGIELGENIAFTQSKMAFARGASRQWQRPWTVQVSPWMNGSCTSSGPLRLQEDGTARGQDAGHSLSFYRRLWLHAWFAGAAMVTPENSGDCFFEPGAPRWRLSEHGRAAAEVFAFMRGHDRGVPYTPLGVVVDHYAGYNAFQGRPWGILEATTGDRELHDLLQTQLFPGADHIHVAPPRDNPEASFLRPTPHGEISDVLLSSAPSDVLRRYPVLLLAGDHAFDPAFVVALFDVLRAGTRLLLLPHHAEALGKDLPALQGTGTVEILETWTNPATARSAAIPEARLTALAEELLPVRVEGASVGYQINRLPGGWVIEIINNAGVIKFPTTPAQIDPSAAVEVQLRPRHTPSAVREWWTNTKLPPGETILVRVPPGESRFVELID